MKFSNEQLEKEKQNIKNSMKLNDETLEKVVGGTDPYGEQTPEETSDEEKQEKMAIHHNAALGTLEQLNKQQSALENSLQKLSSGMEINSAADDPSGYQISERMRGQVRALEQANYNAQNGPGMMTVAEGAVRSTIEILETSREKTMNAVIDTNTEVEREAIKREIDAKLQQID